MKSMLTLSLVLLLATVAWGKPYDITVTYPLHDAEGFTLYDTVNGQATKIGQLGKDGMGPDGKPLAYDFTPGTHSVTAVPFNGEGDGAQASDPEALTILTVPQGKPVVRIDIHVEGPTAAPAPAGMVAPQAPAKKK